MPFAPDRGMPGMYAATQLRARHLRLDIRRLILGDVRASLEHLAWPVNQGQWTVLVISHMTDKSTPQVQNFAQVRGKHLQAPCIRIHTGDIDEHELPEGAVSSAYGPRGSLP